MRARSTKAEKVRAVANISVYALGGMRQEHAEWVRRQGAQGIAGIRCFWPSERS